MQSCNRFLLTSFNEPAREDRKVGEGGLRVWLRSEKRGAGEGGCEGIQFPDVGTLVGIAGVRGGLGYTCERGCACVCVNVCVRVCARAHVVLLKNMSTKLLCSSGENISTSSQKH